MTTITSQSLEETVKNAPAYPEGQVVASLMSSACHPNAPFYLIYAKGTGKGALRCALCGEVWGEILIARSLIEHAPPALVQGLATKKPNGGG